MKQRKHDFSSKLYDKYLRKNLNPEISNVKRIYSKILSDSNFHTTNRG
jgi:hypothetical protein